MEELLGFSMGMMIFSLILAILSIVANWKIYTKAGKPGWAIFIPFYNIIVLLEIVNKPLWWLILLLIPFVNIIFLVIVSIRLANAFGKGTGFALGLIFLAPIFYLILGLGSAKYTPLTD